MLYCNPVRIVALALCVGMMSGVEARAQSTDYSSQQLGGYRFQNSTSRFSTQNQYSQIINQGLGVSRGTFSPLNQRLRSDLSASYRPPSGPAQKPFTGKVSGPSVTPYLGLSSPFSSSADSYYTQVRPRLNQQRAMQQQQSQNARFQRQLNAMAARSPYELQGSSAMAPTGHAAVFQNTLGYYPDASRR